MATLLDRIVAHVPHFGQGDLICDQPGHLRVAPSSTLPPRRQTSHLLVVFHQPSPSSVFIPVYAIDVNGEQRLVHPALDIAHILSHFKAPHVVRDAKGRPRRAQIGASARAASHIGLTAAGALRTQDLGNGRRVHALTDERGMAI